MKQPAKRNSFPESVCPFLQLTPLCRNVNSTDEFSNRISFLSFTARKKNRLLSRFFLTSPHFFFHPVIPDNFSLLMIVSLSVDRIWLGPWSMTNRGNRDRTIGSRSHCMRNRRAVHPSRCTSISRYVSPTRERRSVSRRTSCDSCRSAFQECRPRAINRCFINYPIDFFFLKENSVPFADAWWKINFETIDCEID